MKRTARFLAIVLACCATTAPAQIVFDTADVSQIFKLGHVILNCADTLTTTADIGAPGASSWDFSGLHSTSVMRLVSRDPKTSPYAAQFPTATHALQDTAFTYSFYYASLLTTVVLKGVGYEYFTLGTNLLDHGLTGAGNAYLFGAAVPANGSWLRTPAAVYYGLPMTLGSMWNTTYNEVLSGTATFLGSPLAIGPDTTMHDVTYTVDAYGNLKLPGAPTQEALRVFKVDRTSSKSKQGVTKGYVFLAKNGASVQLSLVDTSASSSGTVGVTSVVWIPPVVPTEVRPTAEVPASFALDQNYPNPFNPSTTIGFTIPGATVRWVTLGVYDMLGREVAMLVNEPKPAGTYQVRFDGSGLASGVYHYRLAAAGGGELSVATRSMLLIK